VNEVVANRSNTLVNQVPQHRQIRNKQQNQKQGPMPVNLLVKNAGHNYDTSAFYVKQQFGKTRWHGWDCRAAQAPRKAFLIRRESVPASA
jgi:hypothetical protein